MSSKRRDRRIAAKQRAAEKAQRAERERQDQERREEWRRRAEEQAAERAAWAQARAAQPPEPTEPRQPEPAANRPPQRRRLNPMMAAMLVGALGTHALPALEDVKTADATTDDPTLRRCIGFAKALGYDGLELVNLYALRSKNPSSLDDTDDPRE